MKERLLAWLKAREGKETTVNQLRKSLFQRQPDEMEPLLKALIEERLVTISTNKTKGRPRTLIMITKAETETESNSESSTESNAQPLSSSDSKEILSASSHSESKLLDSHELAIKSFDWFSDLENQEIDNRRQPFFSVELLRRALAVEGTELQESLNLLEHHVQVIGAHETDIRGRKIRVIKQDWLKPGSRERLLKILKPEPPKPHVLFGAARVLRTINVYVGRMLMTFKEGEIVRDESHIAALQKAGAVLAKLSDTDARMCANPKCQHRFDLSESEAIDFPILEAIRRDFIQCGGAATLWVTPGDLITDRGRCLSLTHMKERTKDTFRELPPNNFVCCPKCKHVSKRNLDLQALSA